MEPLSMALAVVAVLIAVYYYVFRGLNFFKDHGIDHVTPTPLVGNLAKFFLRQEPLCETIKKIYYHNPEAKYVGLYEFSKPLIMLRDIELIKTVAIKNLDSFMDHLPFLERDTNPLFADMLFVLEGNEWKDVRSQLTPMFTSSKIKSMYLLMSQVASRFAQHLTNQPAEERKQLELKNVLTKYTNDVIATCVFGLQIDTIKDPNNALYIQGKKATNFSGFFVGIKFLLQRNMTKLAKMLGVRFLAKETEDFFEKTILDNMKYREENGLHRPDMLQHLLDIQKNNKTEKPFTTKQIVSNAFSFFFGGYDSVANQACLVLHNVLAHPECMTRLQQEVDEVIENTKGQVTFDAIAGMEYMDAVVNEAMRLYPVVVFLDRVCTKDFELPPAFPGAKPFVVKKGMNLWIPNHAIQTDPKYFDNPDKFDPERFILNGKKIMGSGTYIPFGIGPRICIGNRFALIEMKVIIFHILARCDLKTCSKTQLPLKLSVSMFAIAARDGYWMNVEPRKNCSQYVNNLLSNGTCNA